MSKMIRLMHKMSEEKGNISRVEKSPTPSSQDMPKAVHQEPLAQAQVLVSTQSKLYHTVTLGLISLVLLVASMSLVVSYTAIHKINSSQAILMEIANTYKPQSEKLAALAESMESSRAEDKKQLKEIISLVSRVSKDVKAQHKDMQTMAQQQEIAKTLVDELKMSDRLLLSKYIALNDEVMSLKKLLNAQPSSNTPERN